MKKFLSAAHDYLGRVGFYFLLTLLVFAVVALATAAQVIDIGLVWAGALFGVLLAFADYVYSLRVLGSYVVKALVHTVLAVIAFAIAFIWVADVITEGSTAVVGVLMFAVLMTIITVIRCIVHTVLARKENSKKQYDYLYTPKD